MESQGLKLLTHERVGRFLAGLSVLGSLALGWLVSPWFLLMAAGVAGNLIISAITDRCAVKRLLIRMGLPGERDMGRAEALLADANRKPVPFQRAVRRQRVPVN